MADGQQPEDEARTELIPAVETGEGIASTREMPAVQAPLEDPAARRPLVRTDDPVGQRFEPSPPPAAQPPAAQPPAAAPPPAAGPAPTSATPPPGPPPAPDGPPNVSLRSLVIGLVVVVLVVTVGLAAWKLVPGGSGDGSARGDKTSSKSSGKAIDVEVSSFDPAAGGSGFSRNGSAWTTQTYRSATFGNLKKGVGLVLDLGTEQAVDQVSFTADGSTVVLRAADSKDQFADGYTQVGQERQADGATTLSGDGGGEHRYWMIWVTKLPESDGGYAARVSDIQVKAG